MFVVYQDEQGWRWRLEDYDRTVIGRGEPHELERNAWADIKRCRVLAIDNGVHFREREDQVARGQADKATWTEETASLPAEHAAFIRGLRAAQRCVERIAPGHGGLRTAVGLLISAVGGKA